MQERRIEAIKLVETGRIYSLGYILEIGIPALSHSPFFYRTFTQLGAAEVIRGHNFGAAARLEIL